ncbi:MAG: methyl-accepting chemotaxis protein [Desulfitobacteriaceae bacterium]
MFKLKKSLSERSKGVFIDQLEYQKLYECLENWDARQQLEPDIATTDPLHKLIEIINRKIHEREATAKTAMLDFNSVVRQLTSLTSIRQMLQRIGEQTPQIANLSAQLEELAASASEVATSAINSNSFVDQSATTANAGGEKIKQAISFVEHSFDEFEKVSFKVQEILGLMKGIEEIVGVIASVADQTNLLALNAAIEAARAGENGRGFAVVADEVRKLAENTKTSVTDIRQKIGDLGENSLQTGENISSLIQKMQNGRNLMRESAQSIQQIIENFDHINHDIGLIASGSEEQSAVIQESASNISVIAHAAENLENIARDSGQGIYAISQQLEKMRLEAIKENPKLDTYQALELCKTDHLLWIWRIYNMILGNAQVDPTSIGNHQECRLGRWLNSSNAVKLHSEAVFQKLEIPHKAVHELARQAASAYQKGDIVKVEQILEQMTQASSEVMSFLEQLQKKL